MSHYIWLCVLSLAIYSCGGANDRGESKSEAREVMTEEYAEATADYQDEHEYIGENYEVKTPISLSGLAIDTLSDAQLRAFEKRAIQKLADMGDYASIISNKEFDKEMKEQALEVVLANIVDTALTSYYDKKHIPISVNKWLKSLLKRKKSITMTNIEIGVVNPLKLIDSGYKGVLSFKNVTSADNGASLGLVNLCDFYLTRTKKSIGAEEVEIWEVKLGSFRGDSSVSELDLD